MTFYYQLLQNNLLLFFLKILGHVIFLGNYETDKMCEIHKKYDKIQENKVKLVKW